MCIPKHIYIYTHNDFPLLLSTMLQKEERKKEDEGKKEDEKKKKTKENKK